MKVVSLEVNNILSLENASVNFSDSGLVLVEGWNHDAGRANGAGKTAIFNALTFALYDKLPRKVTASEILRRGTKAGYAKVTLRSGDDEVVVKRTRPKGVQFFVNGLEVNWTQEEFEAKIRLSYKQFIASMYCPQGGDSRFLLLNDADKKNFLLQLLNLDEFSECKKLVDEQAKALTSLLDSETLKLTAVDSKIDAYSESLIDEHVYNYQIGLIDKEVSDLSAKIISLQEVPKPDLSKYAKLEDDIGNKQSNFVAVRTRKTMLHDQYKRLNAKIKPFSGDDECYACGSKVDTTSAKKAHEQEQTQLLSELKTLKIQIDECDEALKKEQGVADLSRKLKEKKSEESASYQAAANQIVELQTLIKTKHHTKNNMVLKLENNADLLNKIKTLHKTREQLINTIDSSKREIEVLKTISSLYSPTGAQAYILDSIIESFNESVSGYVDLVWPNVSYKLNSYKESSKGDVTAKFSESLTMDGKDVSIGSLSGGELKALSLCVDFAILDILEKYFGLPLNPIVLDEPFDGLDAVGREVVIDLLEKLAITRQIFVVDHASEAKAMFSQVIRVEKRNGVSVVNIDA